jgi:hypothetical protein
MNCLTAEINYLNPWICSALISDPWFDYLLVSKGEMCRVVAGTGWCIERFLDSTGSQYIAVIRKGEA